MNLVRSKRIQAEPQNADGTPLLTRERKIEETNYTSLGRRDDGGGQGMVECKSVRRLCVEGEVDGRGDPCADRKGGGRGGEGLMTLITGGCRRRRRLRGFQKSKVCIAADRRVRPPENAMLFRPCTEIERDYPVSLHPLLVAV